VKIVVMVEGLTEKSALGQPLREFLRSRVAGAQPRIVFDVIKGKLPLTDKLARDVQRHRNQQCDAVIALTDVYTGEMAPTFKDADDAKLKLRQVVGNYDWFHPHAAQYEFEAWLLPYWSKVCDIAKCSAKQVKDPEQTNHGKPPSAVLNDLFRRGRGGVGYNKTRDAPRILHGVDLAVAADQCRELKLFLNTFLTICHAQPIP
jgi:hypothetical protein